MWLLRSLCSTSLCIFYCAVSLSSLPGASHGNLFLQHICVICVYCLAYDKLALQHIHVFSDCIIVLFLSLFDGLIQVEDETVLRNIPYVEGEDFEHFINDLAMDYEHHPVCLCLGLGF